MTEIRQRDASTQIVRRLDRVLRESIVPRETRATAPLQVAARAVGGEPVPFSVGTAGEFATLAPGDLWGRAWDTVWMHVVGSVPGEWRTDSSLRNGTALELAIDLGFTSAQSGFQAEGLVHTSTGEIVRGLSPLNHRVLLQHDGGDAVEFWVEAAANPTMSTPSGTELIPLSRLGGWDSAGEELIYRFGGAALVLRDVEMTGLRHDAEVLRGIAVSATTSRRRRELVLAALEDMLEALDPADPARTAKRARAVLAHVLAAPAHATSMTLTAVGHAHIDSAWLWPLRETIRKCARTFSNVLSLMEDNPDFVFACSSAQQFQWMKEHYPDLFARIRERVERGQFVPVGGMWVESDTNMPSGESLVRQFVAGQGFFEREFGIVCEEVWLPDSFGYSGALPQIARASGARWFFGQKLSWNRTNRMPHHTFEWEGIDGTRILTHFTPVDTYNSDLTPAELIYAAENFEDHAQFTGGIVPFGYGDGGGGPTREMLEAGRRAADVEGLPHVAFGQPADFFAQAEEEAVEPAVWMGEMYLELHRGTYTSQSRTKRGNRRAEALLREAELWAATAAVRTGASYPSDALSRLWERTLLLQFHDILPGSSISWVHQDAERLHADTHAELQSIIANALSALAGTGEIELVANASPFPRAGVAALGIAVHDASEPPRTVVERDGKAVVLRNALVELRIASDGTFENLRELSNGRPLFGGGHHGNELHLHHDLPTDWDAWDIDEHYRRQRVALPAEAEVEPLDDGSGVRIVRAFGASRVSQEVRLSRENAGVDVVTTVDWHERQSLLKLAFPFRIDARRSTSETQFGFIERPIHENTSWEAAKFETVAHRWVHVGDGRTGAAVVNDSTYGHDITRVPNDGSAGYATQVRQTLLRGPLYPDPESDQGTHVFRSRLVIGSVGDAVAAAYDLDTGLRMVRGAAAEIAPLARVDGEGVVIHTVKLAEDGSGDLIVRLYEALGVSTTARVHIDALRIELVDLRERPVGTQSRAITDGTVELDLRGFEIVTLRASGFTGGA
ncbi:glycoside hydrolase family 38 C-terminal domain-containing protein [Microbacterium oryzae]|uniref:alpha-mannosidase n=1 Tax=Microbacterium oryzae TaxID=743009 RepID=UPI0025B0C027|nr:glycoside hydrolase family 38 C-terminal domain-containing protein [Microbacterium oryzae]MDN3310980.1 glycoside hydrolase family 38 C-terminal domain-containing protein [Microbacterium oryzae]